jgi:hypothetical protein
LAHTQLRDNERAIERTAHLFFEQPPLHSLDLHN